MPVIINNFEIIVEAPTPNRNAMPANRPRPPLRPEEIERIMQHFAARRDRVRAD